MMSLRSGGPVLLLIGIVMLVLFGDNDSVLQFLHQIIALTVVIEATSEGRVPVVAHLLPRDPGCHTAATPPATKPGPGLGASRQFQIQNHVIVDSSQISSHVVVDIDVSVGGLGLGTQEATPA